MAKYDNETKRQIKNAIERARYHAKKVGSPFGKEEAKSIREKIQNRNISTDYISNWYRSSKPKKNKSAEETAKTKELIGDISPKPLDKTRYIIDITFDKLNSIRNTLNNPSKISIVNDIERLWNYYLDEFGEEQTAFVMDKVLKSEDYYKLTEKYMTPAQEAEAYFKFNEYLNDLFKENKLGDMYSKYAGEYDPDYMIEDENGDYML